MDDYLDPLHIDIAKVRLGEMTQKHFDMKYSKIKKSRLKKAEQFVNIQMFLSDVVTIIREQDLTKKTLEKLTEFVDLVVKSYYENEKITFSTWKQQKIVSIREGKMSYKKDDTIRLIRVIFMGKKTIKKE